MGKCVVIYHYRPEDRFGPYVEVTVQQARGKAIRNNVAVKPRVCHIGHEPPSAVPYWVIGQIYDDVGDVLRGWVGFI